MLLMILLLSFFYRPLFTISYEMREPTWSWSSASWRKNCWWWCGAVRCGAMLIYLAFFGWKTTLSMHRSIADKPTRNLKSWLTTNEQERGRGREGHTQNRTKNRPLLVYLTDWIDLVPLDSFIQCAAWLRLKMKDEIRHGLRVFVWRKWKSWKRK